MLKVYKEHAITKIMDLENNITLELSYNENIGLVVLFEDYPIWLYAKNKKEIFINKEDKKIYNAFNKMLNEKNKITFISDYNRSKEKNELFINKQADNIVFGINYHSDLPIDTAVYVRDGFTNNECIECDKLFNIIQNLTPNISREELDNYKTIYKMEKESKIKRLIKK